MFRRMSARTRGHLTRYYSADDAGLGFTPLSISGLQLWLKADAMTTNVDGDPITTWSDSSTAGRNASNTGGLLRPTFKTNIINSKPVMRFNRSNNTYFATSAFASFPSKRGSLFIVMDTDVSVAVVQTICATWYEASGTLYQLTYNTDDLSLYDNVGTVTMESNITDGFHVLGLIRSGDTSMEMRRDGTAIATRTIANNQPTSQTFKIGSNVNFGGNKEAFTGDIAEILLYDTALSGGSLSQVESYLRGKYNL